jgi:hypothetical protein
MVGLGVAAARIRQHLYVKYAIATLLQMLFADFQVNACKSNIKKRLVF